MPLRCAGCNKRSAGRQGSVSVVLVQAKASPKTKQRAEAKGIKLYDDLSPEKVKEVREKVKKRKTGGNNNA